jgi:cyanophycinase
VSALDTSAAGPLALVGGGEWTTGCTFDSELLTAAAASEVLVLPTGSAYEYPDQLVQQAASWFTGLGGSVRGLPVLTRRDAYLPELVEAVRSARFIYLAGSSPMHLRSVLKDTPVFDAMVSAWLSGAALAGTAAGADVLCDPMVDTRGGAFTVGLGVVQGVAVIPRFEQWSPDKVHRTVTLAPSDLFVAGIDSSTALLRSADGTWRVEGAGNVVVYRQGSMVSLDAMQP